MKDVGQNVGRNRGRNTGLVNMAKQGFMEGWLMDNQQNFIETMNLVREGAPVQWARLYMEAYKMGMVKEQNININIVNRQQDRENLQALVRARMTTPELPNYTPYEEVENKREEIKIIK